MASPPIIAITQGLPDASFTVPLNKTQREIPDVKGPDGKPVYAREEHFRLVREQITRVVREQ